MCGVLGSTLKKQENVIFIRISIYISIPAWILQGHIFDLREAHVQMPRLLFDVLR